MSKETSQWLNTMTLIGFTEKRGNAWHYRAEDQGTESNHYEGPVPVADVLRRLFNFTVDDATLYVANADGTFTAVEGRKAMRTSDTGEVLGVFKDGYQGHGYEPWLIDNVSTILSDELGIGSAGLLRNRAQAWVSVEVPDTITTPEGVAFRPNLLACTSFDGSLATTYKRVVQAVVCDNTLSAGLSEEGQTYKLKHSKYSAMKLGTAREALAVVYTMADDFAAEVASLCSMEVTEAQFGKVLDLLVPVPTDSDNKRGITVAEDKRNQITALYRHDDRSAPWNGTAFGVLQAVNTYAHHYAQVRGGVARGQRNMENVVSGKFASLDAEVISAVQLVTAS